MDRIKINNSSMVEFSDNGTIVYFNINIKELFNVTANYPGMRSSIRKAFETSKRYIPIKTGLMRSSYTLEYISVEVIRVFFDPDKILGKTRLGVIVKDYYPRYLVEKSKTFNWLDIVMKQFIDSLISDVKQLKKMKDTEDALTITAALLFLKQFDNQYKEKIEKYKEEQKRGG